MSGRRWVPITLAAAVLLGGICVFLWHERLKEAAAIGACARDSFALHTVTLFLYSDLYPDIDHFLGKEPRILEPEHLAAVADARRRAEQSAKPLGGIFFSGARVAVKGLYLAAVEESQLAAAPRGTWATFTAEESRLRTAYDASVQVYRLERPPAVSGDDDAAVAKASLLSIDPVKQAVARELAKIAEVQQKKAAELAAIENERLASEAAVRGPDRPLTESDLHWEWLDSGDSMGVLRMNGVGGKAGRVEVLSIKNITPWRIYALHVTFRDWDKPGDIPKLDPGETGEIRIWPDTVGHFRPRPTFTGTFQPPGETHDF